MKKYELDDPQKIEDMTRSREYGLVRAFLEKALERWRADLEQPHDMEETSRIRGAITALRTAMKAPESVISEIREQAKRGNVGVGE